MNKIKTPSLVMRIYSVWYRHYKVYSRNLISNGAPVFLEPLILLMGMGFGFQQAVGDIGGVKFINYIAGALIATASMYTASFECSFGTFIRLEFDKVYDGMLSASINYKDLIIGEVLFAATKGFFFSYCILLVISAFGLAALPMALLAPIGGFLTALMFAVLSLFVTSFVKSINHFNFYFSGFLTPLFFFSGVLFPISNLPESVRIIAYILPLSHPVNITRALTLNRFDISLLFDLVYIIAFITVVGYAAVKRLKKKFIF
jgi:lipooligosaccharide transport system permease protein